MWVHEQVDWCVVGGERDLAPVLEQECGEREPHFGNEASPQTIQPASTLERKGKEHERGRDKRDRADQRGPEEEENERYAVSVDLRNSVRIQKTR